MMNLVNNLIQAKVGLLKQKKHCHSIAMASIFNPISLSLEYRLGITDINQVFIYAFLSKPSKSNDSKEYGK